MGLLDWLLFLMLASVPEENSVKTLRGLGVSGKSVSIVSAVFCLDNVGDKLMQILGGPTIESSETVSMTLSSIAWS